ncbi:MAG: hypothetical protein IT381_12235 [Deltaproteobacteria bacterium]|nr:hypothetical protein [Deltaproteobacteria bacterium]
MSMRIKDSPPPRAPGETTTDAAAAPERAAETAATTAATSNAATTSEAPSPLSPALKQLLGQGTAPATADPASSPSEAAADFKALSALVESGRPEGRVAGFLEMSFPQWDRALTAQEKANAQAVATKLSESPTLPNNAGAKTHD